MLPPPTSPDFPIALKNARVKLNLTHCALAKIAGIERKLMRRYEEPENKHFTIPRNKTWRLINIGLGYDVDNINPINPDFIINIFSNISVHSVLTIVEKKLFENKNIVTCKTVWQPSSPYYKAEH